MTATFTPPPTNLAFLDPLIGSVGLQKAVPAIAKDPVLIQRIESIVKILPTHHKLVLGDARKFSKIEDESVHLVVTSPPYWNLKKYEESSGQLGNIDDYDKFLHEIDKVWTECFRVLIPGGRLIIVVGDVCISRKQGGRHYVMPLHASIIESCRNLGFDNLTPIIWHKIANATFEVNNGSGILGKPYEPNAVIKNDIEFILMQRKPGAYRKPDANTRLLSTISQDNHKKWFRQIWSDLPGASTKDHPAPYPIELTNRLIRMFSFVGDTVLDPFVGTGSTIIAAAAIGRNSIGIEVDSSYLEYAYQKITKHGIEVEKPQQAKRYQKNIIDY
ncbi:DNA-methyltransferase [Methanoregula sp.]|uniref:DNA-methyltransferase n=2 Tax=Methanoregula sp. TaxID=2052170 RepID=UPI003BAEA369